MHFVTFSIVTVVLMVFVWQSETTKTCYKAKTCIHDAKEKCGVDDTGHARRFLDSCDIMEYNCYYNTTYVKTVDTSCEKLPPLDKDEFTRRGKPVPTPFEPGHAKVINKWWCWRAKYCNNAEGGKVCGVEIRENRRNLFPNFCTMVKVNCNFQHDFTQSVLYECSLTESVWKQVIN